MKALVYSIILMGVLPLASVMGQDIHFTQFYQAPLQMNPALTGMFNGEYRLMGNFRSQWFTVPVSYNTFKAGFDARLLPERLERDVLGAGLMLYYDQAGDSRLSTLYATGSLAFSKRVGKHFFVGVGTNVGYAQRRFSLKNLTFDDQFNGDVFDPSIVSGDLANFPALSFGYLDVGVGLNLRFQKTRRLQVELGSALHHLNMPLQRFGLQQGGIAPPLSMKSVSHFNASFPIHRRWDLMPHALFQIQAPYVELLAGANFRYHLNENPGRETALFFGATYRLGDAVAPVVGISHQSWQFGLSYDVNVSKFVPATANNGGIEFSFVYIWRKVPNQPNIKICPVL